MPVQGRVESRETRKFSRFAARWWDPGGPMHSLHAINPLRTGFITRDTDVRARRVLDVGCGGGLLSESLARLGARVTGIDLSDELLELARMHARGQGLEVGYSHIDAAQLAEDQPGSFDIVTCMEVLEHVPQPAQLVRTVSRLLKPGGRAFFATLDRTLKSLLFAIVGAEYVLRLLPMGSHTYRRLIRPGELRSWAEANDLRFERSAGVIYNLLSRKFSVTQRADVSYMMQFVRK